MKSLLLTTLLLAAALFASGCDDSAVRQLALQLRTSVAEDEKLIDDQIARQTRFYDAQQDAIEQSRMRNTDFQREAARRMRSAEAATDISLHRNEQVRLARIMTYLHETHDKEFELWQKDNTENQELREDLKSRIAKLERQKKVLTQIKKNLDQLAVAPGSKKRAQFLLQFSRDTYAEIKKSTK
jgi:hypothetical protein